MNHKDFMAVMQSTFGASATGLPSVAGWSFYARDHAILQHPMCSALSLSAIRTHANIGYWSGQGRVHNNIALTLQVLGIRKGATASDIEMAIGIRVWQDLEDESRHKYLDLDECGLVYCGFETAPAYLKTARMQLRWALATGTAKPSVEALRVRPLVGAWGDLFLHAYRQLPPNHDEPESGGEVDETAISGRLASAPFADADKLYFSLPWLHKENELLGEISLKDLHLVTSGVKSFLTPAPAPTDD